jgi:hypothetical protein
MNISTDRMNSPASRLLQCVLSTVSRTGFSREAVDLALDRDLDLLIAPTLRVGMQPLTLRVTSPSLNAPRLRDAERPGRGNDRRHRRSWRNAFFL